MKILNRLTIKHLLMNKKRTIVTIIGITLSMALMLGCGLLVSSLIEEMREDTIESDGAYHVLFQNLDKESAQTIENNISIEKSYAYHTIGFAKFEESENDFKPYYYIAGASDGVLSSLQLSSGRLPENDHEIVVSDHVIHNGGKVIHVGDVLTLKVGTRYQENEIVYENVEYINNPEMDFIRDTEEKEYQVVGIVSRSFLEDYSAAGYMLFTKSDTLRAEKANTILVEFYKPKKSIELAREIKSALSLNSRDVKYNDGLLYFYGTTRYDNINTSIAGMLSIFLGLLSVGSIIVIYNSFAISTMERKKQFGLYSSIGATRSQILHTVFFEAFVVGIIGIVLGIIGSFLGIYVVLEILNYLLKDVWEYQFSLTINWLFILIPIFFMILVVFFSALIPALRSSKTTPIESIRENDDIKMPRRKLKTPKLIMKLFGIEGELAYKNMKRNKKKYRITVLSLFISIVLFISFGAYLEYGISTTDSVDYFDFDLTAGTYNLDTLKEIERDPRVTFSTLYHTDSIVLKIPFDSFVKDYQDYLKYRKSADSLQYHNMNLVVLQDSDFEEYATLVGAKKDDVIFVNEGQVISYDDNNRTTYYGKYMNQISSSYPVCEYQKEIDDYTCDKSLSLFETTMVPKTFHYVKRTTSFASFVSESTYQNMKILYSAGNSDQIYYTLQIISDDYEKLYYDIEEKEKGNDYYVSAPKIEMKQMKNVVLALKILLYGFITLVTLIGVTSVFNTIHTSINLRRKEFAMLRSMGLAPKGFNKMILFESLFFGLKSLFYGLPVSFLVILLIHNSMDDFMTSGKILIPWGSVLFAVIGVFVVVLLAMIYSVHKIKKENILEAIREENI